MDNARLNIILSSGKYVKEKKYWLNKLYGKITETHLPKDHQLQQVRDSHIKNLKFLFSSTTTEKLNKLSKNTDISLYIILVTALKILLHKILNENDLTIGSPVFNQKYTEDLLNTTVAIRDELFEDMTVKDCILKIRTSILEAYENQNYPLVHLEEELANLNKSEKIPLFNIICLLENIHDPRCVEDHGMDFIFSFKKKEDSIEGVIKYTSTYFNEETVTLLMKRYVQVMEQILEDINQSIGYINIITEEEKNKLLYEFNNTKGKVTDTTIVDLFEEQVKKTPENIAVVYNNQQLTYQELKDKSDQWAVFLQEKGLGANEIVGLLLKPSLEMMIAIMGVVKAGGAYLPMDPDAPEKRIQYMLEDSKAKFLITDSHNYPPNYKGMQIDVKGESIYTDSSISPTNIIQPTDLIYVIYTSGTTGNPKGVMIEHRSLVNYCKWFEEIAKIKANDSTIMLSSYAFDLGYTNLYSAILNGCTLHIVTEDQYKNPEEILEYIHNNAITYLKMTPSLFNMLTNSRKISLLKDNQGLRLILLGGESINGKDVENFSSTFPKVKLMNHYGPTEATIGSIATFIEDFDFQEAKLKNIIGRPITNAEAYVLNENLQPSGIGIPGELFIAGRGLARGYLNNDDLTRDRFIDHPFKVGERIYRTGDLVRWLPNGNIEFLGRLDNQVKIRGYRIELKEIENELLKLREIKEAITVVREDQGGHKYLCTYVLTDKELTISQLRNHLLKYLPEYMVPDQFVKIDKIPLTPNGKVNTRLLPDPINSLNTGKQYEKPQNEVEEKLIKIWQEILEIQRDISIQDNFFELGGHSLKATLLGAKIYKELNVEVPLMEIFRRTTIKEMAKYVMESGNSEYQFIEKCEEKEYYPLSSAQKRMYLLNRLQDANITYNMPTLVRLKGKINFTKLENTFKSLIKRHEALRTSFEFHGGEPVQRIQPDLKFTIDYQEVKRGNLQEEMTTSILPFDLGKAPLLRVKLIKVADEEHIMMVDMHHIISDAISEGIIISEFCKIYNGENPTELRLQYKDYAVWQQKRHQEGLIKKQEEYWLNRFSGDIPFLNMPFDYERPAIRTLAGDSIKVEVGEEVTRGLNKLARENHLTMYMILLAVYNTILYRYTGDEEIIIGSPIAGRSHGDLDNIVGIFINSLPMKNHVKGDKSFKTFLQEVKTNAFEAYENQDFQFEELVEKLNLKRELNRNPLYDMMLDYKKQENSSIYLNDLSMEYFDYDSATRC